MGRMMIFWIPLDPGSGHIFEVGISFQGFFNDQEACDQDFQLKSVALPADLPT